MGVEVSTAARPATAWRSLAAAPDGAFYQLDNGKVFEWTSGDPQALPWVLPFTTNLVAADGTYLYGDDDGAIVRYSRASGVSEVLVQRGKYDYESLVMFALGGNRIVYDIGWKLFAYDLATGTTSELGAVPDETYAGFAVDETRAFWSGYRFSDGERAHALGASRGGHVSYVRLLADRVAWVTTSDPGLYVADQ
jgi:hypothetical protein